MSGNGVTAWSYSRYADYQRCPMYFQHKHILRDPRTKESSPAMERGSAIHKLAENYVLAPRKLTKLPKELSNFADSFAQLRGLSPMVEQQWGFTERWTPTGWFDRDTWLRIVTDVTVVYDDGDCDIIDHKTGKMYGTNEEQMELFSCGPFMKFPEVNKVRTQLWYLDIPDPIDNGDNIVEREYTRKDFERIKGDWTKRVRPMFADKKFPPRANDKCKWCPLSKAKGGPCRY